MLNKALLCVGGGQSPEPGYIKAKLTVGSYEFRGDKDYGYNLEYSFGALDPSEGYRSLSVYYTMDSIPGAVHASDSFYYKGVKYNNGDIVRTFIFNEGEDVEVWIKKQA